MDPAGRPFHTQPPHLCGGGAAEPAQRVWGSQPALPGHQAKAPKSPSQPGKGLSPTLSGGLSVTLGLLLLSRRRKDCPPWGVTKTWLLPRPRTWGKNSEGLLGQPPIRVRKLSDWPSANRQGSLTNANPPSQLPRRPSPRNRWGVGVAESPRFSSVAEPQEATHLHFQRPALSASPPPGRTSSEALPRAQAPGGSRGGPLGFPRPQPPPPAWRAGSEGCAQGGQMGRPRPLRRP